MTGKSIALMPLAKACRSNRLGQTGRQKHNDVMNDNSYPAERSPGEFMVFGLGFIGFIVAATGIIVGLVSVALAGALLLVASVAFFSVCCSPDD
jgi:hypothetical protein